MKIAKISVVLMGVLGVIMFMTGVVAGYVFVFDGFHTTGDQAGVLVILTGLGMIFIFSAITYPGWDD